MSISFTARADGPDVRLARRTFHGVEPAEYETLANLSPREARALAEELKAAADDAETAAGQARDAAIAEARKKMQALQVEIARLEAGGPT